jgi:hypothetical protein
VQTAGGQPVALGVLEGNTAATALARGLPLQERPDPPWRMVLGDPRCGYGASAAWQITIGSAAKG